MPGGFSDSEGGGSHSPRDVAGTGHNVRNDDEEICFCRSDYEKILRKNFSCRSDYEIRRGNIKSLMYSGAFFMDSLDQLDQMRQNCIKEQNSCRLSRTRNEDKKTRLIFFLHSPRTEITFAFHYNGRLRCSCQ